MGTYLSGARAVDGTMLCPLSAIAMYKTNSIQEMLKMTRKFLGYAATHPDAIIAYGKSDMVLLCHIDASYLSEPKALSPVGGCHFLSSNTPILHNNGDMLNITQLIKAAMTLAAEAEIGALSLEYSRLYQHGTC